MAPHDLVMTLVRDYLETSTRYARRLHAQAGPEGILGTFHQGALPRRGVFRGVPRAGYELHGSGCRVRSRGLEIDFDLTGDDDVSSIDPWKLYNFALSRGIYAPLPDRATFRTSLDDLVHAGLLVWDGRRGAFALPATSGPSDADRGVSRTPAGGDPLPREPGIPPEGA